MQEYRLRWEIDITAESPREAAEIALEIMRDGSSSLPFFDVFDQEGRRIDEMDLEQQA